MSTANGKNDGRGGTRDPLLDLVRAAATDDPDWKRPSEQAIAAYLMGMADPEQTEEVQRALAGSAAFRRDMLEMAQDVDRAVAMAERIEEPAAEPDSKPAGELIPFDRHRRRRIASWGLAAAAFFCVAWAGGFWIQDRPGVSFGPPYQAPSLRGGATDQEFPPDEAWPLRKPIGDVSSVSWFAWDEVVGAASYRLRVARPGGGSDYAQAGIDRNSVKLPRAARRAFVPGQEYLWTVDALDARGQILVRGEARFTLRPR